MDALARNAERVTALPARSSLGARNLHSAQKVLPRGGGGSIGPLPFSGEPFEPIGHLF
jgi:hypothetical protein